jgi:hypothetical protein
MNETAYYQTLSLTQPLRTRIEEILAQIRAFCPEELKDIFVTDLVQQDGTRTYQSLWAFTDSLFMEAALAPEGMVRFDVVRHRNSVRRIEIVMKDFDWSSPATEVSRLTIEVSLTERVVAHFQAAGPNCEMLRHICVQYLSTGL